MVHHLLIHCPFAHGVWSAIINMFEINWALPETVEDLFIQWQYGCKFFCGRILWIAALYGTIWKLWLERNKRVFQNTSKSVKKVVESIVWSVSEWVEKRRQFSGVYLENPSRSWLVFFRRGSPG